MRRGQLITAQKPVVIPTFVRTHTGGQNKISQTTWTVALDANVGLGNTLILVAGFDNLSTVLGGGPVVNSISVPTTQTVSGGAESNSWQLLLRLDAPNATGGLTVITEVWGIVTAQSWLSSFTPVITLSSARSAKSAILEEWSNLSLNVRSSGSGLSTTGSPSATAGTVLTNDVLIGACAFESSTTPSGDSDTTNGSWSSISSIGTSGGTSDSNALVGLQHKVATSGGSQTYNPTGSNDAGAIILALQPA